jgi:hypothetical protein
MLQKISTMAKSFQGILQVGCKNGAGYEIDVLRAEQMLGAPSFADMLSERI